MRHLDVWLVHHPGGRTNGSGPPARVGLTHMGMTPLRATGVEQALSGGDTSPDAVRAAAEHAPEGTSPPSDTNATAE
jgi:aerobic carbon-monoxide dehydrogenase medium subunit